MMWWHPQPIRIAAIILVGVCGNACGRTDVASVQSDARPLDVAPGDGITGSADAGDGASVDAAGLDVVTPLDQPRLVVLEPPAIKKLPTGVTHADLQLVSTRVVLASANLSLLTGVTEAWYRPPGSVYVMVREPFVWTEESGVVPLGAPPGVQADIMWPRWISADGTSFVGGYNPPTPSPGGGQIYTGFFRWTKRTGVIPLDVGGIPFEGSIEHLSDDGKVVVGWTSAADGSRHPFRWTESGGTVRLLTLPGWPSGGVVVTMSRDGTVLLGTTNAPPYRTFRWTQAGGVQGIGVPPGAVGCQGQFMSSVGSVVFGTCPGLFGWFRWTLATETIEPIPLREIVATSSNGSAAIGYTHPSGTRALAHWAVGAGLTNLPRPAGIAANATPIWTRRSLSDDGKVAYGVLKLDDPVIDLIGEEAFRWNAQGGIVRLGYLSPNDSVSVILAATPDGLIHVGTSRGLRPEAVIWNAGGGIQTVAAALSAAHVDLGGFRPQVATAVWSGSSVILQGGGTTSGDEGRAWVAWLPR